MQPSISNAPQAAWQAESLRLTAFTVSGLPDTSFWWSSLIGSEPDESVHQRKTGISQYQGSFENGKLVLVAAPARIDWVWQPVESDSEPQVLIPNVGTFAEARTRFLELMRAWIGTAPPITRIAFGATLFQPVADRLDGYKRLREYLPNVPIDPEGMRDFLLQVNRPRASRTMDFKVNRLARWSVSIRRQVQFGMQVSEQATPSVTTAGETAYALRLELDINTPGEMTSTLPPERLPDILDELVGLAQEVAEAGDVK